MISCLVSVHMSLCLILSLSRKNHNQMQLGSRFSGTINGRVFRDICNVLYTQVDYTILWRDDETRAICTHRVGLQVVRVAREQSTECL